jgi:pimeloyl-ACP methyl ester carboxylesterase
MPRLRHLIVIIPGIGGSEFTGPTGRMEWALGGSAIARFLIRPKLLDIDEAGALEPTSLVRTFTTFGSLINITGYEGLSTLLGTAFSDLESHNYRRGQPVPSKTDVLLLPYDFRRSVADSAVTLADAVGQALVGVHESAQRDRVIVVAHSMGGLVARYWIGALGGWRVCKALLTLGTPHRGAPKAFDWLVNGPGIGRLRHSGVTRVLRRWPSVYELLPQYPAIWDEREQRAIETYRLPAALVRRQPRLKNYEATFAAMSGQARRTHADIAAGWQQIPAGRAPDLIPCFGRGHPTVNLMRLSRQGALLISKEDPPWRGNVGWAGDGTVPALSAVPAELGEARAVWRGLPERHGDLACTSGLLDPLVSYNGAALPTRGQELPEVPWLGIDLDDVVPSGEPVPLGVRVQPNLEAAQGLHVSLTSADSSRRERYVAQMTWDGDSQKWHCMLPKLDAGRFRLSLEGVRVAGPESVFARADLVAVDPVKETEPFEDGSLDEEPRDGEPVDDYATIPDKAVVRGVTPP